MFPIFQQSCPSLSEQYIFQTCYPMAMLKMDTQKPLLDKFKQKFGVEPAARLDLQWERVEPPPNEENARLAIAEISSESGKCSTKIKVIPSIT
jgi:hypothetical protein